MSHPEARNLRGGNTSDRPRLAMWLADTDEEQAAQVGPKAANLAVMLRAGFPVPPGFCVVAGAYREHLEAANLMPVIDQVESKTEDAQPPDDLLARVRRVICDTPLEDRLRDEIAECWARLGGGTVAVRSSATAEDLPGRSFAGQHETFLGVGDLDTCLQRIKECWASLWSERALEYRRGAGIDGAACAMAVLVQRLVPAEASGVMFTADPVSGRRDAVVIEAAWGLGPSVVTGRVRPDRIVVSKRIFRIERRYTARKDVEVVQAAGGVRTRPVNAARAAEPCVDDSIACWLGHLGARVETLFGRPQDVEWALAGGEIHLLQSRAITVLPDEPARSWEDRQVWTDSNVREALPEPITPMTWSIVLPAVTPLFEPLLERMGIDLEPRRLFGLVGGRGYFNVNTIVALLEAMPLKSDLSVLFGGGGHGDDVPSDISFPKEDIPQVHVPWLHRITRMPRMGAWLLWRSLRSGRAILAAASDRLQVPGEEELAAMDEEQLALQMKASLEEFSHRLWQHAGPILMAGMASCLVLMELCRRWLGDDSGATANRLLSGMGGLADAEAGLALWALAQTAHERPPLAEAIREEETFVGLSRRIGDTPAGGEFLDRWSRFMREHGHHARMEIDLANPRWSETPDYVLGLVRTYLTGIEATDPVARARRLARQREELQRDCARRLRNPIKRAVFRSFVRRAQDGLRFRETSKSLAIHWIAGMRSTLLELGGRLAQRGAIASRDDVFFLEAGELDAVVSGELDARPLIERRRAEHKANLAVAPPAIVFGRFEPEESPLPAPRKRDVLTGMAVSPGIVTGKARVIPHDQADYVRPGEVLVAPVTDPGWAPHFVSAAGIVIDQGGLLSHGSIVAREYGIPCVVNVGPASEIIRTGQTVRVDGTRGEVTIVEERGESPSRGE